MSNMTETSFLDGTHGLWFLFLLMAVNLPNPIGKAPSKKNSLAVGNSADRNEHFLKRDVSVSSPFFRSTDSSLALPEMSPYFESYSLV
jgi:hypothetical protein